MKLLRRRSINFLLPKFLHTVLNGHWLKYVRSHLLYHHFLNYSFDIFIIDLLA